MCVASGGIYLADVILSAFSASGSHNIAGELFTVDLALGVLHAQVHGPVFKASPPDVCHHQWPSRRCCRSQLRPQPKNVSKIAGELLTVEFVLKALNLRTRPTDCTVLPASSSPRLPAIEVLPELLLHMLLLLVVLVLMLRLLMLLLRRSVSGSRTSRRG